MILDFIARTNNISYNSKLAKLLGVYSSIYLSLLIDLYSLKHEEFIKLSRDDIYNITAIEEEKQLEVEDNLKAYNLVEISPLKNSSSKNYYKLNTELINKIIMNEEKEVKDELDKTFDKMKIATKAPAKVSKRACIIDSLKKAIQTQDALSKGYLEDWVDAAMQKTGYLSKRAVEYMEQELKNYAHGSIRLLRDLYNTAARLGYKEPQYVINKYEQLQRDKHNTESLNLNNVSQEQVNMNIQKLKDYEGETF